MRRLIKVSFQPIYRTIEENLNMLVMSDFFHVGLFIDCALQQFVEMHPHTGKNNVVGPLSHRHLVLFIEEYGDYLTTTGHARVDDLINEVSKCPLEISAILNLIYHFFLNETNYSWVDLTTITDFNSSGFLYAVVLDDDK